jgi:hypothetical protein
MSWLDTPLTNRDMLLGTLAGWLLYGSIRFFIHWLRNSA